MNFLAGARRRNSSNSYSRSIRQEVFIILDKNPLLTSKPLCKLLNLNYETHGNYVKNLRLQWKRNYENERGSKCSIHAWRGYAYIPIAVHTVIHAVAVDVGWVKTRARNRWLLWKDRLGRLQWFETGRVNLFVRKPANLGKAYQLICNGFSFTGLITDIKVLENVLASVRFKGAHYVFPAEQWLPRLTIDLFAKSNGVIIKVGDQSHPNAVEVIACYPDWAERNERMLEQLNETLKRALQPVAPNNLKRDVDYVA